VILKWLGAGILMRASLCGRPPACETGRDEGLRWVAVIFPGLLLRSARTVGPDGFRRSRSERESDLGAGLGCPRICAIFGSIDHPVPCAKRWCESDHELYAFASGKINIL
jgi:hypothetical protein